MKIIAISIILIVYSFSATAADKIVATVITTSLRTALFRELDTWATQVRKEGIYEVRWHEVPDTATISDVKWELANCEPWDVLQIFGAVPMGKTAPFNPDGHWTRALETDLMYVDADYPDIDGWAGTMAKPVARVDLHGIKAGGGPNATWKDDCWSGKPIWPAEDEITLTKSYLKDNQAYRTKRGHPYALMSVRQGTLWTPGGIADQGKRYPWTNVLTAEEISKVNYPMLLWHNMSGEEIDKALLPDCTMNRAFWANCVRSFWIDPFSTQANIRRYLKYSLVSTFGGSPWRVLEGDNKTVFDCITDSWGNARKLGIYVCWGDGTLILR